MIEKCQDIFQNFEYQDFNDKSQDMGGYQEEPFIFHSLLSNVLKKALTEYNVNTLNDVYVVTSSYCSFFPGLIFSLPLVKL